MDLVAVSLSLIFVFLCMVLFAITWRLRLALMSFVGVAGQVLARNAPELSVAFAALVVFSGLVYAGYVTGQSRRALGEGNGFGVIAARASLPAADWSNQRRVGALGGRGRILDRRAHHPKIGEFAAWCPVESGMVILRSRYLEWLRGAEPRPSRTPTTAVTVKTDDGRLSCEIYEDKNDAQQQLIECPNGRSFTLNLDSKALEAREAANTPDCVPYDFFSAHRIFAGADDLGAIETSGRGRPQGKGGATSARAGRSEA